MISRRDFIRQLVVTLLVILFGPRVRELIDWDEAERLVERLDTDRGLSKEAFERALKELYPKGLEEILYGKEPTFFQGLLKK